MIEKTLIELIAEKKKSLERIEAYQKSIKTQQLSTEEVIETKEIEPEIIVPKTKRGRKPSNREFLVVEEETE